MPRAIQPVTESEIDAGATDCYPDTTSEMKAADFGLLAGQVLALDYGLHEAIEVKKHRAYYSDLAKFRKSKC